MKKLLILLLFAACFAQFSGSAPPLSGSIMKIGVVDNETGADIAGTLKVSIDYTTEKGPVHENYTVVIANGSQEVSLGMPPKKYDATATIIAGAEGYYDSEPLVITSQYYWENVGGSKDTSSWGTDVEIGEGDYASDTRSATPVSYLMEHKFMLQKKSMSCCVSAVVPLVILLLAALANRRPGATV